jgi:hypothetical protein
VVSQPLSLASGKPDGCRNEVGLGVTGELHSALPLNKDETSRLAVPEINSEATLPKHKVVRETSPIEKLPKAQGIVMRHIIQAYVYGSERQQRRIEVYGKMNRQILLQTGQPTGKVPTCPAKNSKTS